MKYKTNEYGTLVSEHVCETCGVVFTVCPAAKDETSWRSCSSPYCESYDPDRDVDLLLAKGVELLRKKPRGLA
jgi:hypothetical protein